MAEAEVSSRLAERHDVGPAFAYQKYGEPFRTAVLLERQMKVNFYFTFTSHNSA